MKSKFAAVSAAFILTTGCAVNSPPTAGSPEAGATSIGASTAGTQMGSAGSSAGRTRAEVNAEAVEAVKHYKSTQSEERDYFNPFVH